ncbi:glucosaminidase domain-containing protein [Alteromonas hispanica]|uniref:Flagellar biosynthesis protein FlgJ n=1 Tax=Alteromonas hispanica TaxID=315421 RepID=A0A6L9MYI7_9ALTE|nr:glucosaminidase domain-containing protein [Alteromonas hispanica]NDW23272.1 flagellar biosynthesis protein FlgJ [Alteromonas hispanica]
MPNTKFIIAIVAVLILSVVAWFAFFAKETPPDFKAFPAGPERKTAFFSYFSPIVIELNKQISTDRSNIKKACEKDSENLADLDEYLVKYGVEQAELKAEPACDVLLRRADIVPVSLALAQAANESAWGTSRFALQGNNFFGQWCFKKGCGIVPKSRDTGKVHEVADFRSPAESVESYMMNLNRHDAYKPLRTIRQSLREKGFVISGLPLTHGLNKYSERGEEYGKELRDMITFNDLTRFDRASD